MSENSNFIFYFREVNLMSANCSLMRWKEPPVSQWLAMNDDYWSLFFSWLILDVWPNNDFSINAINECQWGYERW